jgi:hypothetical protein
MSKNNRFVILYVFFVFLFVLGCEMNKGFRSVTYGCVTKDGSKIALTDFNKDFQFQTDNNPPDKYRLILDGKSGKIIWKDLKSSDQLVCAEDNSIISISETGAKWVEGGKEVVFSEKSDARNTNFVGIAGSETIVRESRSFSQKKMDMGRKTSSLKDYNSFPTLLIDKPGEKATRRIEMADLEGVDKTSVFTYYSDYSEDGRIIFTAGEKVFTVDVEKGTVEPLKISRKEFLRERAEGDPFNALATSWGIEGFIEIYDLRPDEPKLVKKFDKKEFNASVEHIIDCCNHNLLMLYWENGNYLRVARINQENGQIIWKSESLQTRE